MMIIIESMQTWIILFLALVCVCIFAFIVRSAYIRGIEIQEREKTMRSQANAAERANIKKMEGLFEIQLAKLAAMATGEEGSEMGQFMELLAKMKGASNESGAIPGSPGLSWDVLKEQLKNPELKKILIEHKDEAIGILTEK